MKIIIKEIFAQRKLGAYFNKLAKAHIQQSSDAFNERTRPNAFSARGKIDKIQTWDEECDAKKPWWSHGLSASMSRKGVPPEIVLSGNVAGLTLKDILTAAAVHFDPMSLNRLHEID